MEAEGEAKLERPRRLEAGNALDLPGLLELAQQHGVKFLKAMQCLNIAQPLGQGLWEGVPLCAGAAFIGQDEQRPPRLLLGLSQQRPQADVPVVARRSTRCWTRRRASCRRFVAYRLNGQPIPLERGGPVRMVVPWAHGFKSIKWLQRIVLTNDYQANDTYAQANNDPESYLKTAAYIDDRATRTSAHGKPVAHPGHGDGRLAGLERVEYWLRPEAGTHGRIGDDDPAWQTADWRSCTIEPPPNDWEW